MAGSITFFLGAGASKAFGLPLTNEIFPLLWKKLHSAAKVFHQEQQDLLKSLFDSIYPGLEIETPIEDQPNITDVLSILDHFINSEGMPVKGFTTQQLENARRAIEIGIVTVIQEDFFDYDPDRECDILYDSFLKKLHKIAKKQPVNIISTNYDILVEYGFFSNHYNKNEEIFKRQVDFGFRWRDPTTGLIISPTRNPKFKIYKLHGSTNWLICDMCGQIYVNIYGSIHHNINSTQVNEHNTCHCGHYKLSSVIVAPSMERDVKSPHLRYVWNGALESLRTSSEWVIAGYSLPAEDLNIRSILKRAFVAHESKPEITVIQKGDGSFKKYQQFFGKINYVSGGMEAFLNS